MILTITLNPSIDRRYTLNRFEKGEIFRAKDVQYTAGGKGLNVTRVIKDLNGEVMATGFLGGFSGDFILKELDNIGIKHNFIPINGETRSCLAIISEDAIQTEILEGGPVISQEEGKNFLKFYRDIIKDFKIIVASGSLPKGVSPNIYSELVKISNAQGKKFILDTSGQALNNGIKAKPYLVKPNKEELEKFMGTSINVKQDIINGASYILDQGVKIVVVSLGEDGSMAFYKDEIYRIKTPSIKTVNPVGSGDAMIGGFAFSLAKDYDFEYMLKFATACGTANAMEEETGKVDLDNIDRLIKEIKVERIS